MLYQPMSKQTIIRFVEEQFDGVNGFVLSEKAIQEYSYYYNGFLYDEMSSESFYSALEQANVTKTDIFYN